MRTDAERERDELRAVLRAVRDLAESAMTEAVDGGLANADTVWPSEIIDVLEGRGR